MSFFYILTKTQFKCVTKSLLNWPNQSNNRLVLKNNAAAARIDIYQHNWKSQLRKIKNRMQTCMRHFGFVS